MTLNDPLWTQNLAYSGTEDRTLMAALVRGGVVGFGDLKVAQRAAGTNMSVDVAAGTVAVPGTDAVGQGTYLCTSTAVENVSIGAAPSAGNTRLDLVVAKVRDSDIDLGANNDWIITVVVGTPASTPVEPTAPVSCVVLARVSIASGVAAITNAMITERRTFANHLSPGTSTALPLARTGQLAATTNTDVVLKGQSDGTWRDVLASALTVTATGTSMFGGTPPSIAATKWKVLVFSQSVPFLGGVGVVTLPVTLTGIMSMQALPHIDTTPMHIAFYPGGAQPTTGSLIPVRAFNLATSSFFAGSHSFIFTVIGW